MQQKCLVITLKLIFGFLATNLLLAATDLHRKANPPNWVGFSFFQFWANQFKIYVDRFNSWLDF